MRKLPKPAMSRPVILPCGLVRKATAYEPVMDRMNAVAGVAKSSSETADRAGLRYLAVSPLSLLAISIRASPDCDMYSPR